MEMPAEEQKLSKNEVEVGQAMTSDSNPEYITFSRISDDIVQLVRGSGGQIQEVHVTDDAGNVQLIHYATNDVVDASELPKQDDPSFEFYDNARGKINLNVLSKLATKYNIDDPSVSKQDNLVRWDDITNEYNAETRQSKSRSVLMKRWASLKSSTLKKPKTIEDFKKKSILKKEVFGLQDCDPSTDPEAIKKSVMIKQLKAYDALKIEAAQYERNARKLEMENALLENESLRKENSILDIQLEAAKLELAFIQGKVQSNNYAIG